MDKLGICFQYAYIGHLPYVLVYRANYRTCAPDFYYTNETGCTSVGVPKVNRLRKVCIAGIPTYTENSFKAV